MAQGTFNQEELQLIIELEDTATKTTTMKKTTRWKLQTERLEELDFKLSLTLTSNRLLSISMCQ